MTMSPHPECNDQLSQAVMDYIKLLREERRRAQAAGGGGGDAVVAQSVAKVVVPSLPASKPSPNYHAKPLIFHRTVASLNMDEYLLDSTSIIKGSQSSSGVDIDGIHYIPDFLSPEEEADLVETIYIDNNWTSLRTRRLQQLGGTSSISNTTPLPEWASSLCGDFVRCGLFPPSHQPNHILINEYTNGEGIMKHMDGPLYYPQAAIISLESTCIMHFYRHRSDISISEGDVAKLGEPVASVVLEPRSLLVFNQTAYTKYLHGINDTSSEAVGPVCINQSLVRLREGDSIRRGERRVSLTVRYMN